jgi:glutathione S-transferase
MGAGCSRLASKLWTALRRGRNRIVNAIAVGEKGAAQRPKKVGLSSLPMPTGDPSFELSKEDLALPTYLQPVRAEQRPRPKKGLEPKGSDDKPGSGAAAGRTLLEPTKKAARRQAVPVRRVASVAALAARTALIDAERGSLMPAAAVEPSVKGLPSFARIQFSGLMMPQRRVGDDMTPSLYAHPFSSYCQKVLIALYENDTPFAWKTLAPETPANFAELAGLWPLRRFPVLVDDGQIVIEASIIIEYLSLHYAGSVRLLPSEPKAALDIRFMDRFFDNYVMTPMQRIVGDALRTPHSRDPVAVTEARSLLATAYSWLDQRLADREWAAADAFSLADCAAAPALFYADWVHPIPRECARVLAYRRRLLERPSFARVVDEARPYRALFPLGAPDRD